MAWTPRLPMSTLPLPVDTGAVPGPLAKTLGEIPLPLSWLPTGDWKAPLPPGAVPSPYTGAPTPGTLLGRVPSWGIPRLLQPFKILCFNPLSELFPWSC